MRVTIEGVITSKELKTKQVDNKTVHSTELLLAQPGEKVQAAVRLDGDKRDTYELFERAEFSGRLFSWTTRDGVGMMVKVSDQL